MHNDSRKLTPDIATPFNGPSAICPYISDELRISGRSSLGTLKNLKWFMSILELLLYI